MQTWYAGSAVDQLNPSHDGVELAGSGSGLSLRRRGIVYFEWSCDAENPDASLTSSTTTSTGSLRTANPAYGSAHLERVDRA
jgi:hypothetical protein